MIIVLAGPTGSGKSHLAIELAKKINGCIINADAFQVYEELGIATAKPTADMMMEVPHFLFDFIPLSSAYNVAEYQKDLRSAIGEVLGMNKNVIIAGGTGLYIRAGLYDYEFADEKEVDMSLFEKLGDEELYAKLKEIDPESALKIHPHNRVRVMRAIKVYLATGSTKSSHEEKQTHKPIYDVVFYGLEKERADLYEHTNARVDEMFDAGLVGEDKALIEKYGRDTMAFRAIGVKELFPYLDGFISLEEAKEEIKKNTRNYIKRQMTFFNHQFDIKWISSLDDILEDLHGRKLI